MKTFTYKPLLFIIFVILVYLWWMSREDILSHNVTVTSSEKKHGKLTEEQNRNNKISIAVVACEDRLQEALNVIKSAIMFTKSVLNFIIIAEEELILSFDEKLSEWKSISDNRFNYKILPLTFPKENADEWRKLFKPCAAQRLFLPSILKDVDSILYVDTDTLFLTDVAQIWEHFYKMNSTQMAALAPEHEDPNVGWYNRFARHPFYGKLGVNSGVMLMNLTRMREFKWTEYVVPIYKTYKLKITWGDQDIINIIFYYHPDKLYIYPCHYNFRPDHCMYTNICKISENEGIFVLHGNRGFFHSTKQPVFQVIYKAFEEFQLGNDIYDEFYLPMESYLESTQHTNCGHIRHVFLQNIKKCINIDDNNG